VGQFEGQLGTFRGWEPDRPCYRCFVGDPFDAEDCDTCAENGVLGATTAAVGGFTALLAIRALARVGDDPAGGLHLFNGLTGAWRRITLPADPQCRTCSR
jgi:adenylyltransferase/sulfurtransferase